METATRMGPGLTYQAGHKHPQGIIGAEEVGRGNSRGPLVLVAILLVVQLLGALLGLVLGLLAVDRVETLCLEQLVDLGTRKTCEHLLGEAVAYGLACVEGTSTKLAKRVP